MKLVLDANVAIMWALPEPESAKALALQDDTRNGIHDLLAPETLSVEIGHALTRAERRGLLKQGDASAKLMDILAIGPDLHPYMPLLLRAMELSSQLRIGVFDCLYVALAEREQCKVVTADQRMIVLFPAHVISLSAV